jgi:phosphoribosylformimino-5-aminoimidazole carboxamide ribotide isomerase
MVREDAEVITHMVFDVIPVLDIKHGQAVHAVAGPRADYQPLRSIFYSEPDPIKLARALRDRLGVQRLYLADLDAIESGYSQLPIYRELMQVGLQLWIDAGARNLASVEPLLDLVEPRSAIVAGMETIDGPRALAAIISRAGAERVVFSLDLDDGRARMAKPDAWSTADPFQLSVRAIEHGVRRLLILDLSRVGTGRGTGSDGLLIRVREAHPEVDLIVGGGVSGIEEIARIKQAGASGVLIGSAIHDGRIGRHELVRLLSPVRSDNSDRRGRVLPRG